MGEQATPFQHSVHTVGRSMGGWPGKPPNDRDERVAILNGAGLVHERKPLSLELVWWWALLLPPMDSDRLTG